MKRIIVLSGLFIFYAYGGTDALTIRNALQIAEKNNPEINMLRQELKIKKSEFWLSTSLSDPEISFMSEGIELNSGNGFAEKRYTISQSFDFPLTTYFRLSRLSNEEEAIQNRLDAATADLKIKVKSAYTELIYSREILELQKQQLKIAHDLNNATKTRFEVGEASALDLMKTEIQIAEAQNDRDDAALRFNEARYNLFKIIGLDPEEQTYSTEFADSLAFVNVSTNQEKILAQLEIQPEILASDKVLGAAGSGVREAWSTFLPNINASYYRQDYGTGYDFYGYEIGLNIPLWFLLNQRGHIEKANAVKNSAAWQKKEIELEMKRKIEFAWHSYDNSRKTIERFRSLVRVKALKLRDLTLEGYQSGELDLLTLLEAQRTYINNEKHYFTALKEYYLNIIELEKYLRNEYVFKTE